MQTMTCDEVRELLPEHLLGTLEGPEDLEVRRHLRGCSACREERMKLEDGVAALSRAVHDQEPPADLRDRVMRTLDEARALPPRRGSDGEAHTWLVTGDDLSGYDRLTITTPDGNVVATGAIHPA